MQFFKSGTFVRCREEQCVVERRTRFLLPDLRGSWGSACPSRLHATKSNKLLNPFLGIDTHVNEDTGLASSEMRSCKAAGMPPSCKGEAEAFLIVHSLFCLLGSATDHNRPRACACDSSAVLSNEQVVIFVCCISTHLLSSRNPSVNLVAVCAKRAPCHLHANSPERVWVR